MKEDLKQYIQDSEKLEDDFIAFWDSKKESLGLGNYSSDITQFWLDKLNSQMEGLVEKVVDIISRTSGIEIEQRDGTKTCLIDKEDLKAKLLK